MKNRKGRVLTYWSRKGGVGKTTLTGITAYELSQRPFNQGKGYRCLVIDLNDTQNLTGLLERTYQKKFQSHQSIVDGLIAGDLTKSIVNVNDDLDIIPGPAIDDTVANGISGTLMGNLGIDQAAHALNDALRPIRYDYDYILIDPTDGQMTDNLLNVDDINIAVPFMSQVLGYWAMLQTVSYLQDASRTVNLHFAGIISRFNEISEDSRQVVQKARKELQDAVFKNTILPQERVASMTFDGINAKDVWSKRVLDNYRKVIQEFLTRLS